jgi:hypothetical protein
LLILFYEDMKKVNRHLVSIWLSYTFDNQICGRSLKCDKFPPFSPFSSFAFRLYGQKRGYRKQEKGGKKSKIHHISRIVHQKWHEVRFTMGGCLTQLCSEIKRGNYYFKNKNKKPRPDLKDSMSIRQIAVSANHWLSIRQHRRNGTQIKSFRYFFSSIHILLSRVL